jgi:glycosyltransferase involved in cell wall biosynthesis
LRRYEAQIYRSVDRVIVLTAHERFRLLNIEPGLRINVIPCGVDTEYFRPAREYPKEEAILYTGQYELISNVDAVEWFVATCWPILKARRPGLKFYVVGPGGKEAFPSLPEKYPAIMVTGHVEDVRPFLQRAMLYVCPVRQGSGLRFKLFEAMASGLPVVTTTLGAEGIPLQNGDNCFMADKPEIMAECIDLLLGDESLRQSIADQARELVEQRFAWDHGIDQLEALMQDTLTR